jgi:hypothetical protein
MHAGLNGKGWRNPSVMVQNLIQGTLLGVVERLSSKAMQTRTPFNLFWIFTSKSSWRVRVERTPVRESVQSTSGMRI